MNRTIISFAIVGILIVSIMALVYLVKLGHPYIGIFQFIIVFSSNYKLSINEVSEKEE